VPITESRADTGLALNDKKQGGKWRTKAMHENGAVHPSSASAF
jgi:hypothetical protein